MMSYINETDFVIENKELVYPEIITDGLQLYYDAKGKRDTDYHRDTMLDMSGNNNHGTLHNFAYEKHSGYKDGLVFDYIDDKLVRPALNLQPDDFTFMLNGNIISFSPDGTVKRVQDGEVIESKGINLVRNGNFNDGLTGWSVVAGTLGLAKTEYHSFPNSFYKPTAREGLYRDVTLPNNHIIYLSTFVKGTNKMELVMNEFNTWTRIGMASIDSSDEWELLSLTGLSSNGGIRIDTIVADGENYYDDFIVVDLTETFGTGNEPTKEEMDAIINLFGFIPNAQDLIDRIEYNGNILGDMENIIDGLYKTEVLSGQELFTSEADDSVMHVDVDGKSYQNELGYRLDFPDLTGKYLAATSSGAFVFKTLLGASGYYEVDVRATNDESVGNEVFWQWNSTAQSERISLTRNWQRLRSNYFDGNRAIGFRVNVAGTELEISNQLVLDYISPDSPSEIHSLNDFDVVSSVGGRNLLKEADKYRMFSNDNRAAPILDEPYEGHRRIKRIPVSSQNFGNKDISTYTNVFIDTVIGSEYTTSMEVKPEEDVWLSIYSLASDVILCKKNVWTKVSGTGTATSDKMRMWGIRGSLAYNFEFTPWIEYRNIKYEKGNTATDWTPAHEDIAENDNHPLIDKINLLLDEPLRSVGDVKDKLFRDSDGLWKVKRNVGGKVFDGSEGWGISDNSAYSDTVYRFQLMGSIDAKALPNDTNTPLIVSNMFNPGQLNFSIRTGNGITQDLFGNSIYVFTDKVSNLSGFKTFLSNSNLEIIYENANPTIKTLDQELQDKLNNLRSFEDSNYVYTVINDKTDIISESLEPTLHAKFLYNNWYKEDRVINNLMIYNRGLTNEEMLQNYKTIKRRWGM